MLVGELIAGSGYPLGCNGDTGRSALTDAQNNSMTVYFIGRQECYPQAFRAVISFTLPVA
jgi:hypothetical protein